MTQGRSAAFFDLDRTLISGSSGLHWSRAAGRAGLIGRRMLAEHVLQNARFRLRGSTDGTADRVMGQLSSVIGGRPVVEFERLAPQVLAGVLPRVYPRVLELAWAHKDAGRLIYIATAATQDTAEMVARVLGFDGAAGTRLEVVDGRYTGRLDGPFSYREGKATAIRELAGAEGIDLAASYAYSDSESDLPMLRTVGNPVAVNPDPELARVARQEGWEIVRCRRPRSRARVAVSLAALAAGWLYGRAAKR